MIVSRKKYNKLAEETLLMMHGIEQLIDLVIQKKNENNERYSRRLLINMSATLAGINGADLPSLRYSHMLLPEHMTKAIERFKEMRKRLQDEIKDETLCS